MLAPFVGRQSLDLGGPVSLEAGCNLLRSIMDLEESPGYWQGDAYLALERQHGREALANHLTADEYDHLRPYIWVSERCPPEIRQPSLSWSHHRAVGAVEESQRAGWLQRAADEGWTVTELKAAITGKPATRRKLDRRRVLDLVSERVGETWRAEDEQAVREALGEDGEE